MTSQFPHAPNDVEPYPSEWPKIKTVHERLNREFGNTPMTSSNQRHFEMAVSNQFGEIGFTTEVEWYQVGLSEEDMIPLFIPKVVFTGRTKSEKETDHDRMKFEITHGLADGQAGFIREDGTKTEDPIRKIIT